MVASWEDPEFSEKLKKSREAGHSDEDISNFLSQNDPAFAEKFKMSVASGHSAKEVLDYLSAPKKEAEEGFLKSAARTGFQALGALKRYTYPADIAKGLVSGASQEVLRDLEENDPDIIHEVAEKQREKLVERIPTQELAEELIEEHTGLPLRPKTHLQRQARLAATAAGFGPKGVVGKGVAALTAPAVSTSLQAAGVPESISDALGLLVSAFTPEGAEKLLSGKAATETVAKETAKLEAKAVPPPGGEPPPPPSAPPAPETPPPVHETKPSPFVEKIKGEVQKLRRNPESVVEELIGEKPGGIPKSMFEHLDKSIANIKPVTEGKPLGIEAPVFQPKEGKSLTGRVTEETRVGDLVTPRTFKSEAKGGQQLESRIQKLADEHHAPISPAYDAAEMEASKLDTTFQGLVERNERLISRLENVPKPNTGQKAVLEDALAIRDIIGTPQGYREANAWKLLEQAKSMSRGANYDLRYAGYKDLIKGMVGDINQSVLVAMEEAGLNAGAVQKAKDLYAKWADTYLVDELAPFMKNGQLNPEQAFRAAVKDPGTYRAVRKALQGKDPLLEQLDRVVVESRLGKYEAATEKGISKVGSKEYVNDINNLAELIGQKEANRLDTAFRQRKAAYDRRHKARQALREMPKKPETAPPIKGKLKAFSEKIAEHNGLKPEALEAKFNSRSGIRELREKLTKRDFEIASKMKIYEVLSENKIKPHFTGKDLFEVLNEKKNFEIFSEIIGREESKAALEIAERIGDKEMAKEAFTQLPGVKPTVHLIEKFWKVVEPLVPKS